MGGVRTDLL